ncbi:MAG: Holliday junction branch migration protein RuvA [Elusimicrobiota bacterium]
MIAFVRGTIIEKAADHVIVDTGGVGYQVAVAASTAARLPDRGEEAALFVSESAPLYGGETTLYGFISREDKDLFLAFKSLKATGAKKALEYLDKVSKSLPDFRRAIFDGDIKLLGQLFGFTRKTAERLVSGLKDKLGHPAHGALRVRRLESPVESGPMSRAMSALSALGYKSAESREALESIRREIGPREIMVEEIIRLALRKL